MATKKVIAPPAEVKGASNSTYLTQLKYKKKEQAKQEKHRYPLSEILSWKAVFDSFDKDGSGTIEVNEFAKALSKLNEGDVLSHRAFNFLDKNGDGTLSFREWLAHVYPYASGAQLNQMVKVAYGDSEKKKHVEKKRELTQEQVDEINAIFNMNDLDKNGTLDLNELIAAFHDSGYDVAEVQELLAKYDTDHNNVLDKNEFLNLTANGYRN
eukprot:Colp12_sorted_trinity150504_noHs@15931